MKGRIQREAERAALVQRFQLAALLAALQRLERDIGVLESESARQSVELERLDDEIGRLFARLGVHRPTDREVSDLPDPVDRGTGTATDAPSILPEGFVAPGADWEAYLRNVERYVDDHGIEVAGDPLLQMLPGHRTTEILRRFDAEFGFEPWDRWDWAVVGLAVLVGAATDYLLVATPGGSFGGRPQRGSPLTAWMKGQSRKLAPTNGSDGLERNAFQQWIAKLTTAAEGWAKVPYDVVVPKDGLTPNVHRLSSLGHDPLLGLVFGVGDVLSGTCTFIDEAGAWRVVDVPGRDGSSNVFHAMVKVVVHGFSDVFTERGLPPPFMAPFQLLDAKLRKGGDSVSIRDVSRYMYGNGYDLRHYMTMSVSPAVAEIVLASYHAVRACAADARSGKAGIPERLKREQMGTLTHGLLGLSNVLKTALYGWNPMAINLAQFHVLAKRMLSLVKLSAQRDRLLRRELDDGWKELFGQPKRSFPKASAS